MHHSIQLEAVKGKAPVCGDYGDEIKVIAFERAVRVHRAHAEAFSIALPESLGALAIEKSAAGKPAKGRSASTRSTVTPEMLRCVYGVTSGHSSGHGRVWRVDMVDGLRHDVCNCPDFLSNGIGTCKHLEAVRRLLRGDARFSAAMSALEASSPEIASPVLIANGLTGRLELKGPMDASRLEGCGLKLESGRLAPIKNGWPRPGRLTDAGIRVTHGAASLLDKEGRRHREASRREHLQKELEQGRLGVDVLRLPLFPYQQTGVRHLVANGRAMLADDMGLGKTIQAIAACEVLRARGEARTILIVTPASLKEQWASEILRYTGQQAQVISGGASRRREALQGDAPYRILNYELTWRELSHLQALEPDVLVLDEAQRARNFRTRTAETLRVLPSRFLFLLTGTPVENRLDDLYSLMQLINPDVLGPLWRFNLEHHTQDAKGRVVGTRNMIRLRERIAPVVLRRRKEEVLDQLPALTVQTRYTRMEKIQVELEEGFRQDASRYLKIMEKRALTQDEQKALSALLLKARQACNALELCDPARGEKASPKLDEFEALIAEIVSVGSHKVLVFSEWVEMLKLASERLDRLGIGWAMLSGRVPSDKRPALLEAFRRNQKTQVLLCSDAGGAGLNLQVASYVVHLDLPWNPAKLDQRNARAHRLGQSRGVSVIHLCALEGIERGIEGTLEGKRAMRSAAVDFESDADEVEIQGFSVFLRQLGQALQTDQGLGEDPCVAPATPSEAPEPQAIPEETSKEKPEPSEHEPFAAGPVAVPAVSGLELSSGDLCIHHEADRAEEAEEAALPEEEDFTALQMPPKHLDHARRAQDRLRLAKVVLDAGFPADAIRSAYDALAASLIARLDNAPEPGHGHLVAAVYRELIPSGRVPLAVPGTLARLHDLTMLEHHGVEPDPRLARSCVEEAESWVGRLAMAEEA